VGDPLTRPFAKPPRIIVENSTAPPVWTGTVEFTATAESPDSAAGISRASVFIGGRQVAGVAQSRLPAGVVLTVAVTDRAIEVVTKEGDGLDDVQSALKAKLAEVGVEVQGRPGNLLLLRKPDPNRFLEVKSSSPLLRLTARTREWTPPSDDATAKAPNPKRTLFNSDLAWVSFGFGPERLRLNAKIDSTTLPDGRQRVLVVARSGAAHQAEGVAQIPVVVRNGAIRVRLEKAAADDDGPSRLVARGVVEGLPPTDDRRLTLLVDGHPAGPAVGPPWELRWEPKRWSAGPHELTARLEPPADGRPVHSDNALTLEAAP
ncbi:MAG: hypothetical protein ACRDD1_10960, partial [Planctomycetia bacterium]